MEKETAFKKPKKHMGRNMRRVREIMGVTQDTVAMGLGISQPNVWKLEQQEDIKEETLAQVAEIIGVPVDAIKNYEEEATRDYITNSFSNNEFNSSTGVITRPTITYNNCVFYSNGDLKEMHEKNKE